MSQSIFEQYEIFQTMNPVKLQVMKKLTDEMQGRKMKDAAPLLMSAMAELKKNNMSFTPQETAVLMEILTKDMNPQEKAKVEMMKNVVKNRTRK